MLIIVFKSELPSGLSIKSDVLIILNKVIVLCLISKKISSYLLTYERINSNAGLNYVNPIVYQRETDKHARNSVDNCPSLKPLQESHR